MDPTVASTSTPAPAHLAPHGRKRQTRPPRLAVALALAWAGSAQAHDTWFAPLPPTDRGEAVYALGTGEQFPRQQTPIALHQLETTGCRSEGVRPTAMRWVADRPDAIVLRSSRALPATAALTCWAQLKPIKIEIDDATVELYFREVNATPAVRERWSALRARGVRWQETYTKHARVEQNPAADPAPAAGGMSSAPITGLGMDLLIESPQPLRAGDMLRAQVLRDGQPLAGLAVELRSDVSPVGFWRTTDAEGRLQLPVPLAARWLLRATELRPAADSSDGWDSRFITLAFDVLPRR